MNSLDLQLKYLIYSFHLFVKNKCKFSKFLPQDLLHSFFTAIRGFVLLSIFTFHLFSESVDLLQKINQQDVIIQEKTKYKRTYFNMKNRGIYKKCLPDQNIVNENISQNLKKEVENEYEFRNNLYNKLKKDKEIKDWIAKFISYDTELIPRISFLQQNQPAMVNSFKDYLGIKRKNLLNDVVKNSCTYYKKYLDAFDLT